MAIQSAEGFMDRVRKAVLDIDDMDSVRNKALAWNDLIEEATARDAAIRAEERERCERVVYRAKFGTEVDRHSLVLAIRARAQPAERAKETSGYDERAYKEANGWRMRPDGSYFKPGS